ncbi:MAG: A/G-specific adenine glycosylase [Gammaproteobacteria bacterium]|nr:A/G-specific adenine glycosylase [Gammaproteobacteria bacterium]
MIQDTHKYFASNIVTWWGVFGRKTLPWQINPSKYKTWISEIMLQQTQVRTVGPYFLRFMERFPTIEKLASSSLDEVLQIWSGLGYYARARNIHRSAGLIMEKHQGKLPSDYKSLLDLPGIGKSTAGAILSLSGIQPQPILDGNVKRVLSRFFGVKGWSGESKVSKELWDLSTKSLPADNFQVYTQGIMDLGATVCLPRNPNCSVCPIEARCYAYQNHLIDQIPHKKTKRKKRTESKYFLMLIFDGNKLYLERRKTKGIWGGLWSFPEIKLSDDPKVWCQKKFSNKIISVKSWKPFKHSFSHYNLYIHPIEIRMDGQAMNKINKSRTGSFNPEELTSLGLSSPVKGLVKQLD